MEEWERQHVAVMDVLKEHFSNERLYQDAKIVTAELHPRSRLDEMAQEIITGFESSSSLLFLKEHLDGTPKEDISSLRQAARYIRKTREKLSDLGIHGQFAIANLATESFRPKSTHLPITEEKTDNLPNRPLLDALHEIELALSNASIRVNAKGRGALGELGDTNDKVVIGRTFDGVMVARECAEVYRALTDKAPGFSKNRYSMHGPFTRFVADVFAALGIEGSAPIAAEAACKWFRGES